MNSLQMLDFSRSVLGQRAIGKLGQFDASAHTLYASTDAAPRLTAGLGAPGAFSYELQASSSFGRLQICASPSCRSG